MASEAEALEWLHLHGLDACDLDDRSAVTHALALVPAHKRNSEPICLAVQAALKRLDGNVDKAIELYARAINDDSGFIVQAYESLCGLHIMRREMLEAEDVLARALTAAPENPRLLAMRAALRAERGDKRAYDDIATASSALSILSDLGRARTCIRLSRASYTLGNVGAAETYAQQAGAYAESAGSNRQAAVAYHVLCSIYSNDVADVPMSLYYANLAASAASKADDKTHWYIILVVRYSIAAEIGDRALLIDLRKQLNERHGAEKFDERFAILVGDSLHYAWTGSFDTMHQYLNAINLGRASTAQKAVCAGLRGVASLGCGDEKAALKSAYLALSIGRPAAKDPATNRRLRMLARTMAVAVLVRAGRRNEAMRICGAFSSHSSASIRNLMRAVIEDEYSKMAVNAPDLLGYGLMFQALQHSEARSDGAVRLTKRETEILQSCARGDTARTIAEKLSIDEKTVIWHRNNVLKKLSVSRTISAVTKARSLGLIS